MRQRTKGLLVSLALAVGLSAAFATVAMAAVITGDDGDNVLTGTSMRDRIDAKGGERHRPRAAPAATACSAATATTVSTATAATTACAAATATTPFAVAAALPAGAVTASSATPATTTSSATPAATS